MRERNFLKIEDLTFLIDTREKHPFDFHSIDERIKTAPASLATGDYSIAGMSEFLTIERKSLSDLIGCCSYGRERFSKEIVRMLAYPARCVVVEAPWSILTMGDYRSKITPEALVGTVTGWMEKGVCFFFANTPHEAARFAANFMFISARRRYRELQNFKDALPFISKNQKSATEIVQQ